MKNLADFRKRIAAALLAGTTVDFTHHEEQKFLDHPFAAHYPDGLKITTSEQPSCLFGRLQSNSFTRWATKKDGTKVESWMDFGKAGNWSFPDTNTAVWTDRRDYPPQWTGFVKITYKFN